MRGREGDGGGAVKMFVIASSAFARAGDASATTRGAVIHLCVLGARSCLATTASGRARLVVVDDRGGVIRDDVVVELDGGAVEGDGRVERRARRPPYWSAARTRDGAALVGTSGNYVLECAYDVEAGARGESDWFQIIGDALGPHTGYVRDVVATRDGRRAWSCACNFAPRWNASGDGGTYEPTSERETLELFTGDILSLALSERECEGVFVFCGVADGTIRAFDGTGSPPIDMGVVGGTSSTFRGRVAAMCVVDDELLVSGCHDGRVVVHDARVPSAPKIARGEPLPGKVHDVCALEDGRILVAGEFGLVAYENARGRDGRLVVVDDAFGGVRSGARALALDESRVFVGTASGDVFALDAA